MSIQISLNRHGCWLLVARCAGKTAQTVFRRDPREIAVESALVPLLLTIRSPGAQAPDSTN
jgi:hypothetical protein